MMTVCSDLFAMKQVKKGDAVGYGCKWRCPEDMPIGIVHIGYADGYPRHAKNGAPVLVNQKVCSVIGTVSMDMIAVDLRPCPNAKEGDVVTLWGDGLPIEKVASCASTIAYELLTNIKN